MLTQVSEVRFDLTATALEAAMLENERIKTLRPPYNQQLTGRDRPLWFFSSYFDSASSSPTLVHRHGPVPSEHSLAPLGALIGLLSEPGSTPALRAAALATSERWAPEEAIFAAGFGTFFEKHLIGVTNSSESPRRRTLDVAKNLLLSKLAGKTEDEADSANLELAAVQFWDPERVARHIERNLAQAYQLLRRARWISILYDSEIVYREPGDQALRYLVLRGGDLLAARAVDRPSPTHARDLEQEPRQAAAFDRVRYDRLRVLTTELKRVRRDGGDVTVVAARGRQLTGRVLDAILRLV
jgi:hypothetical protein